MPGVTAQTRSRTWRLQFWLARRGETDAVSVMCFCCITTSYTTILLSYCSLTPPYYAILHCKRQHIACIVKYFCFSLTQEGGCILHKKYINIELYLPYIDILEDILTHISERLLHITLDCCYISHWTVATYHTGLWFAIWYHIATYCNISGISGNIAHQFQTTFSYQCASKYHVKSPPYLRIYVSYLAYLNISVHIDTGLTCLAYQHIFVHISTVLIYINNILMFSPYRLRLSNVQNIQQYSLFYTISEDICTICLQYEWGKSSPKIGGKQGFFPKPPDEKGFWELRSTRIDSHTIPAIVSLQPIP